MKSKVANVSQHSLQSQDKSEEELFTSFQEMEEFEKNNSKLIVTGQQQNISLRESYHLDSKRTTFEKTY